MIKEILDYLESVDHQEKMVCQDHKDIEVYLNISMNYSIFNFTGNIFFFCYIKFRLKQYLLHRITFSKLFKLIKYKTYL